jgi:formamidopyrimidine-DNA glycosylase
VTGVRRRAKYLLIDTAQASMLNHLGMTGWWRIADAGSTVPATQVRRPGTPNPAHDHLSVSLVDGRRLVFNDPRRFGMADLVTAGTIHPSLADLGPEPLGQDFSGRHLFTIGRGRRGAIKALIMDQAAVVGVGNIYAQEALFRARIRPTRPAGRLRADECDRLADEIRTVLREAIAAGGSTISDFVHAGGGEGLFQHRFQVYDRGGQPCPACGAPLHRAAIAGRTTCWCRSCQR